MFCNADFTGYGLGGRFWSVCHWVILTYWQFCVLISPFLSLPAIIPRIAPGDLCCLGYASLRDSKIFIASSRSRS